MYSPPKRRGVLLLSTVHSVIDPRIMGKIRPVLLPHYEVYCALVKTHSADDSLSLTQKLNLHAFANFRRLLWRLVWLHPQALWYFLKIRPQIVHIFVAELLPLAFVFRWLGAEVIYEVQENLYKKIPLKSYNRGWFFERMFRYFDQQARQSFKFVLTEDAYLQEYKDLLRPFAIVHNFAESRWLSWPLPQPDYRNPSFFYAGVISLERGFDTMVAALKKVSLQYPNVHLRLFGHLRISEESLRNLSDYEAMQNHLTFYGYVSQEQAFEYAKTSLAGIVLLKPVGDYVDSYPTKLFDYMALGLPVITSDLPLLKEVIEAHQCGFCVSAYDADSLAHAMITCIENPVLMTQIGQNGRDAVIHKYNWEKEGASLLNLYGN
ncbi:glycosyltransferase [Runella sp. MFBS21]|uniref:glycosyltransferase n=1 Tax=Runella sp. MFBS21 TaxID=3034018 RepID=UPI0023F71318|nr:glycosyltransferase [Runella sp. MFBS21]MDF7817866.1 glycosyltransferase [Runella sp. MFBS21]